MDDEMKSQALAECVDVIEGCIELLGRVREDAMGEDDGIGPQLGAVQAALGSVMERLDALWDDEGR